jgi:uncharacterized delta-60 repeat protein
LLLFFGAPVSSLTQCVPASTAAGTLDTCFGTGGKVVTEVTPDRDFARALAIQPDGKIVVAGIAGYSAGSNNADFLVVRYNSDGSLDTTFDSDGIAITDFGFGLVDDDYCRGVAVQPDGKIVLAGRSQVSPTTYAFALIRYNSDGSPDTSFSEDGKAQFEMAAIIEMYGFALQPDGKMVVGGRYFADGAFTGLVVRFNSDGSLDSSFGTNGTTSASVSGVFSVALQTDGKILVAGTQGTDTNPAFALGRLNTNGSADLSFGNGGLVIHHPTVADQTWFVRSRFDNQIFLGGYSSVNQGDPRGTILRFNADGSFGQGVIRPEENAFWSMTFQPDGKALAVGASHLPFSGFTVTRYVDIGTRDASFNGGAAYVKFLSSAVSEASSVNAIAMTRDNKIIAAGSVTEHTNTTSGWRLAIAKLHSGLRAPAPERFDFDGDQKADLSIFRPSSGEWWTLRSSTGAVEVAQFGSQTDKVTPGDYTGDGKTDVAVWRPSTGEWFILRSEDSSYYSVPFGTSGDIPRPSDFDGDGKTDLVVYRPSSNVWYRINSIGIGSFLQFGISGDHPLAGDFDGDAKSDPAVFRPSTGEWWYRSSIDHSDRSFRWGSAADTPVPADFDGDAKTDFAVYRASTGVWYRLNSSDGSIRIDHFGLAEDRPVPADYDGDGRADIALFRPSMGVWYMIRSSSGFAAIQFGTQNDIPSPSALLP